MRIYPAIDIKAGQCVRLYKGDLAQATVYHDDPITPAREFAEHGFGWLHVVDLDGATSGHSANRAAVERILAETPMNVQLGGGIRTIGAVETWLGMGVGRVILGTAALKTPELVWEACRRFPGQVVVGIDARGGMVATEGWLETSATSAVELAKRFEDDGVAAIIYTDIARDGTLSGPNTAETVALAEAVSVPVIASGGVSGVNDLKLLAATGKIAGVIVGKAFYDGRIALAEARALDAN